MPYPSPPNEALRQWRKRRGLTQEQVAERIGVTATHVSMIERGARQYNQKYLARLALALDLTVERLLAGPDVDPLREEILTRVRDVPANDLPRLRAVLDALHPFTHDAPPPDETPRPAPRRGRRK